MKTRIRLCGAVALSLMFCAGVNAGASPSAQVPGDKKNSAAQPAFFAKVGDVVISHDDFNAAFNAAARGKFYHGTPPENEVAALQREVADQLVARVLLLREAKRRGLTADKQETEKKLQGYEQRYANNERWKEMRDKVLPELRARVEEDDLVAQLEKLVRNVRRPTQKEVKAYYAANPDKFTEPEQLRVSVILIKVDPSSPAAAWVEADEKIRGLIKQLESGADFATLAREHSMDHTARHGGDLGYLHLGMLPEGTEAIIGALKLGETSKSMRLLEGVAVFRVTDRKLAKLNSFEKVEGRAGDLLHRDQADAAWKSMVAELKKKTPAKIDQSHFLPLAGQAGGRSQPPK